MNPNTGRRLLVTSFLLAVIMATWSEVHDYKRAPVPSRYVGAGVAYGLLGVLAPFISFELAGLFGVGLLLALVYQHYQTPPGAAEGNAPTPGGEGTPKPTTR
jgi:hypothetical protein